MGPHFLQEFVNINMVNKFGTFETVRTQADCDFYAEYYGKEEAQKQLGTRLRFIASDAGPGKIAYQWTSADDPSASTFVLFHEGVEQTVNMPPLGQSKIKFLSTADGFDSTMTSEKYGVSRVIEKYSDDGVDITITYNGKTNTEVWKRKIDENGYYRICSNEGFKAFMEDLGMSDDVVAATVSGMKILWKATDTGFEQTEWFGDIKVKHGAKFNEEIDYKFPLDGAEASKMVTTKIATGKYKQFCKNPDGSTTEWTSEFGDGSWCIKGKNHKTGLSCKGNFKKYTPIGGTWKTIAIENVTECMGAIGAPSDMVSKVATDFAKLEVEDQSPVLRWNWISSVFPMDIICKLDEETEFYDPVMQDNCKLTFTSSGNKLVFISKYSTQTWINSSTITDNFMIIKSYVEGLNCPPMIYVMERCN